LTITSGGTGEKHHFVMLAGQVKKAFERYGFSTKVVHSDIDK